MTQRQDRERENVSNACTRMMVVGGGMIILGGEASVNNIQCSSCNWRSGLLKKNTSRCSRCSLFVARCSY